MMVAAGFEKLHSFFYGLSAQDRERFITDCGSTQGYIQKVLSSKVVGRALAQKIECASRGKITLEMIYDAEAKAKVRDWRSDRRHVRPGRDTPGFAQFRSFINAMKKEERAQFAKDCGVTLDYLRKALWRGFISSKIALKIEMVSKKEITRDMIYPKWKELWHGPHSKAGSLIQGLGDGARRTAGVDMRVQPGRDTPGLSALRVYLNSMTKAQQEAFAEGCGTSVGYLRTALSRGVVGPAMALKIERASKGEITRDLLCPEWATVWPEWKPVKVKN
jgi:DNA-binding transcriptional regulator YdaS (Cro superfamily)